MHKKFKILGVDISAVNIGMACQIVDDLISQRKKSYVCVAPVSTVIFSQEDDKYKEVINDADMVTPDGMPLVWLARLCGYKDVKRTYGPDLMLALCDHGQQKGYNHYLLGGSDETLINLEESLKQKFPKISVVGKYSPPFRDLTNEEHGNICEKVRSASPDILWIGLGSPKQEFWMKENCGKLNVPISIAVGAAFDFLAGTKPQAPVWMQRCGLEWLFRLCCEPRRLAKRYFVGNTKFVFLVLKSFIKGELVKNGS